MNPSIHTLFFAIAAAFLTSAAHAHVTYTGRDFGVFAGDGTDAPVAISISNLSGNFGWADATDADFGDSHRTRAFRFTLTRTSVVTLHVNGATVGPAPALPYPAFSLYRGLCHIAPAAADHDATAITSTYLNSLGGPQPKEGAFFALGDWKIGNDDTFHAPGVPESGIAIPASLSSLTYIGHAADGTAANYGTAPGIHSDGLADGQVSEFFTLPAGDYSIFIGGADYAASLTAVAPYPAFGLTATLTVTPAPEAIAKDVPCPAVPGSTYRSIAAPATNGHGVLAFRAGIKAGKVSQTIIGRRTVATTALAKTGDPAPGTASTWASFGDPVLNEAGEIAFNGLLKKGTGGALATNDAGLWSDLRGSLHLVAREGDAAPGTAAGQLFKTFTWLNLQPGVLYFAATISDGTAKGSGIWAWDGSTLAKVVLLGDSVILSDGRPHIVKTISRPTSAGNGNATSRIAGTDRTLALLLTTTDAQAEVVTFRY